MAVAPAVRTVDKTVRDAPSKRNQLGSAIGTQVPVMRLVEAMPSTGTTPPFYRDHHLQRGSHPVVQQAFFPCK